MAAPPPSGMPTASTTGVPDGTTLKPLDPNKLPYSADQYFTSSQMLVINTPNAVYDAYKFDCFVEVRAPGVRISRSLIRGQAVSYQRPMLAVSPGTYAAGQPSAVIEDSTVDPAVRSSFINGVQGSNFTLRRVEITGVVDGVHIHGTSTRTDPNAGNVTVQGSWIHDLPHYPYNGGANGVTTADGSHNDGVQFVGGHNVTITGTRIDGAIHNAGIMMAKDRNDIYTINISNNWLGGGAVTINVADKGYTPVQGLVMNNNVFFRGTTRHVDFAMFVVQRYPRDCHRHRQHLARRQQPRAVHAPGVLSVRPASGLAMAFAILLIWSGSAPAASSAASPTGASSSLSASVVTRVNQPTKFSGGGVIAPDPRRRVPVCRCVCRVQRVVRSCCSARSRAGGPPRLAFARQRIRPLMCRSSSRAAPGASLPPAGAAGKPHGPRHGRSPPPPTGMSWSVRTRAPPLRQSRPPRQTPPPAVVSGGMPVAGAVGVPCGSGVDGADFGEPTVRG